MSAVNLPHKIEISDLRNDLLRAGGLDASKFTSEALRKLDERIKEDLTEIVEAANHYARRSEVVTEDNVILAIAARNTSGYHSRAWKYCGMIGGAMLGTGIQLLVGIPPDVSALAVSHLIWWGAGLTAAGMGMLALSAANE